ncbi:M23 family metallopeptidase [Fuchsiella alkaliacetigena]|uniref:M23 family metallopeptidase n=1 Tax=Fuchsiella alkaliacetigena TaxID=957042 RepID=UPI00200A33FC|nr:M23 family metallopeptidase [Fuchsiella alkaliacetigena]MCK8824541.1 M23 family metallopeptidase [Fuchsiella alkaliacetigena]
MSYYDKEKKITIKIIPHLTGKVISFQLPRIIPKLLITFLLIGLVGSSLGFAFYYQQNKMSLQRADSLSQVKERNKELKSKLHTFSEETEVLEKEFREIQETNQNIKRLIDYDDADEEQQVNQDFESGETITYNNEGYNNSYNSYNQNWGPENTQSTTLISSTRSRLSELSTLIPEKRDELKRLKESVVEYNDYLASKPSGWPVKTNEKRITSKYGYRSHPVTGRRTFHNGLDIGVWYGTEIYATGEGKVIEAGWKGGYGRTVIIDHGFGYRTLYGHNQSLNVSVGDKVERGELIAYSGNSGQSTGPHLHYEVHVDGKPVDPLEYIE